MLHVHSRYIKTIALQIEITKYFQQCHQDDNGETMATVAAQVKSKVPTLFGSQQARNDLAIMVTATSSQLTYVHFFETI